MQLNKLQESDKEIGVCDKILVSVWSIIRLSHKQISSNLLMETKSFNSTYFRNG